MPQSSTNWFDRVDVLTQMCSTVRSKAKIWTPNLATDGTWYLLLRSGSYWRECVYLLLSYLRTFIFCHFQSVRTIMNWSPFSYWMLMITICWSACYRHLAFHSECPCSVEEACPHGGLLQRFPRKSSALCG